MMVVVVLMGTAACGPSGRPGPAAGSGEATVVRVVDGDTVVVRLAGTDETVRLIGIDTPETKDPGAPVECFGPEAAAGLERLLPPGAAVRLERDAEARDRFGRLLAYAFRAHDGAFVEEAMLTQGLAAVLDIDPNNSYRARLHVAARSARDAGRGLWSACGGPHVPAVGGQPPPSPRGVGPGGG
ncbi:MAG: thermonuclease family protein [Acidimicrobiia bacterium]